MLLPVLRAQGATIAEAWERSIVVLAREGLRIRTEYDRPDQQESIDAAMVLVVNSPLEEPRIHLAFPGGLEDLEKYRQEVVAGVHDSWIDPKEGKWTYTYHDRLFNYRLPQTSTKPVNQIALLIEKLSEAPYSRRAQAITWIPFLDPLTDDPPCLQRVWCRIIGAPDTPHLVMHCHWRSRDALRAAFMNLFGLTDLQRMIAQEISQRTGTQVKVGQYVEMIDSYHIYGDSIPELEERFLRMLSTREFYHPERTRSRTMRSDDPTVQEAFRLADEMLKEERRTGRKGIVL